MSDSLLTVALRHKVGAFEMDVNFRLTKPWTVLFGPSGSGKTTVLRSIAGFVRPDAGRIEASDDVYFDSLQNVFVPPHRRAVRSEGQMAKLFPHLKVIQNVTFGSGYSKPLDVRDIAEKVMDSFQLRSLADRSPHNLSGGELRRASVARALVSAITRDGPRRPLLVLDEPLAGVDATLRDVVVTELKQWTTEWSIPVLSVTHDLGEAFQLEAEVIKIDDGKIIQQGPVAEVLYGERLRVLQQLHS